MDGAKFAQENGKSFHSGGEYLMDMKANQNCFLVRLFVLGGISEDWRRRRGRIWKTDANCNLQDRLRGDP